MSQSRVSPWATLVVNGTNLCQDRFRSSEKPWETFERGPCGPWDRRRNDRGEQKGAREDHQGFLRPPENTWHHFSAGSTTVTACHDTVSEMRLPKQVCVSDICQQPYPMGVWSCTRQRAAFCRGRLQPSPCIPSDFPAPASAVPASYRGCFFTAPGSRANDSQNCSKNRIEGPKGRSGQMGKSGRKNSEHLAVALHLSWEVCYLSERHVRNSFPSDSSAPFQLTQQLVPGSWHFTFILWRFPALLERAASQRFHILGHHLKGSRYCT